MKTIEYKITDAKTKFFTSKENYMKFRQAWKAHVNTGGAKKVKEQSDYLGKFHNFLYTVLRGKSLDSAYTPITNYAKIVSCGNHPYGNVKSIITEMKFYASRVEGNSYFKERAIATMDACLEPFGETIDRATIVQLIKDLPDVWHD
jgi:hypothetical protein